MLIFCTAGKLLDGSKWRTLQSFLPVCMRWLERVESNSILMDVEAFQDLVYYPNKFTTIYKVGLNLN